jgi:transposase
MKRQYPSDVTERQLRILKTLIPKRKPTGRPPLDRRLVLSAILYVDRTGCQWRQLPIDFPNWKSVYTVLWMCRIGRYLAMDSRCDARTNQAIGDDGSIGFTHRVLLNALQHSE